MKYQNNQHNIITLRANWELHKTGRLDHKKRGRIFAMHSEFRYHSENSAMIAKFRYHSENSAMIAKFRYHSENLRHSKNSNFRYAQ